MSIYHSKNQSNSKEEYRGKEKNGWHYTYLITIDHDIPDEPRKYYIGVRTSKNGDLPEEDIKYLSSSDSLNSFLKEHPEAKVTKTVLAYFLTRKDAGDHEIELHSEFKVASNPEYFNLAESTGTGFSTYGITHLDETRQKMSDWYNDPANADAIAKKKQKHSDWYDDPANADAIAERRKKSSESLKAYRADPANADAIADRNEKLCESNKAWRTDPKNADAIAECNKKISESKKNTPKFVCRISDRKEYRFCDVAKHGLEKLGLISYNNN